MFIYVIGKSNIMLTWQYIIVLNFNIKGMHNFKYFCYIHMVEIPTQKGEHSCKCTELSLKRKEGKALSLLTRTLLPQCS